MTDDPITDTDIAHAMIAYGGSFSATLGEAFHKADAINRARVKDAFPDLFEKYRRLVVLQRKGRHEHRDPADRGC